MRNSEMGKIREKVFRVIRTLHITVHWFMGATQTCTFNEGTEELEKDWGSANKIGDYPSIRIWGRDDKGNFFEDDFDFEESKNVEDFLTLLMEEGLNKKEAEYLLNLFEVNLDEKDYLRVFKISVEELLTHSREDIRKMGLEEFADKTD